MDIALLNEKITIQSESIVSDAIGNRTNVWTDCYSCYATVSGEGGSESVKAGIYKESVNINFTIRWCNQASVITPVTHRVLFKGEAYSIDHIDHAAYKKRSIKLCCKKERTDG